MIKLAFMVDKNYILGSSTKEGNELRFKLLPKDILPQIALWGKGDHYVAGRKSLQFYKDNVYDNDTKLYIITRDKDLDVSKYSKNIVVETSVQKLIDKYKDSKEILTVIGGKQIFIAFLDACKELAVIMSDELVLGDIKFDEWDTEDLTLVKETRFEGGVTKIYRK
ncbi:MAG: dihydrofolate reductase [Sphaerochaetaceae bacterium]|nr:dihydrofolate reductase [Sphaerochaetaceae bacterium]